MISRKLALVPALLLLGAAAPALAQSVPADADKALWCASAFTLVGPQARAAGQSAAAQNFATYARSLETTGHDSLIKAGFSEDQVKAQFTAYETRVAQQLGGAGKPQFDVETCTALVDPDRAAQIRSEAPAAP